MISQTITEQHKIQTNQRIWSIDWHPQGKIIASVGSNKVITLWAPHQQKYSKLSTIQTEHTKTIRSVKFSHKGDKIAVGSFDATISVWVYNQQNHEYELLSNLEGHQNEVKCVSWSNDDKKIASCSRDKNIWVWEFDKISYDYTCDSVLEGHTQDVKFVDWFPNQPNKLVSASYDNSIRIWQGEDDDYICQQVLQGHKSIVWNVQILANYLFSVSEDCTVIQWGLSGESQKYGIKRVYSGFHFLPIYSCCVLSQKYICTGGGDNSVCILPIDFTQAPEDKQVNVVPIAKVTHEADINCLKTNPKSSNTFASCSDDQTIRIWRFKQN